jgi:prepilin-type processing-associated H-X9-DG protein
MMLQVAMGEDRKTFQDVMADRAAGQADDGPLAPVAQCPAGIEQDPLRVFSLMHYGSHPRLMPPSNYPDQWVRDTEGSAGFMRTTKVDEVRNPSSLFVVADTSQYPNDWAIDPMILNIAGAQLLASGTPYYVYGHNSFDADDPIDVGDNTDTTANRGQIRFRHSENANLLFLDGHVAGVNYAGPDSNGLTAENVYVKY